MVTLLSGSYPASCRELAAGAARRRLGRSAAVRLQPQRHTVDAIPVVGRSAVALAGEHVAQVGAAVGAAHLGPDRSEGPVLDQFHPILRERRVERRPPAMRIELVLAAE